MKCPACKDRELSPGKLAYGLPAMTCRHCHGALIDLYHYRLWRDKAPVEQGIRVSEVESRDLQAPARCPKCATLMRKYRISAKVENRLDLCGMCASVWMDGGEWSLLGALELTESLTGIVSDSWQREIRKDELEAAQQAQYLEKLGVDDYAKLKKFQDWVTDHPQRDLILQILNRAG